MNFFEQQDQARSSTRMLVGLFCLSVAAMTGGIYAVTLIALNLSPLSKGAQCIQSSRPEPIAYLASRKSSSRMFSRSQFSRSRSGFNFSPGSSRYFNGNLRRSPSSSYLVTPAQASGTEPCKGSGASWWNPQVLFWVTLVTATIVGGASLYKTSQLKEGGAVIAQELGGQLLLPEIADEQGLKVLNVVEEMAIASGIPVP
jgi:hypothetical protein